MIQTGLHAEINPSILKIVDHLQHSFEYYLPDEKLSQLWQETEVISTEFSDFEAVFFDREFERGKIFVSEEFEYFPVYVLYLITVHGAPNRIEIGELPDYDMIGIEEGTKVLQIGFCNPEVSDNLLKHQIPLTNVQTGTVEMILDYAQDYLEELHAEL